MRFVFGFLLVFIGCGPNDHELPAAPSVGSGGVGGASIGGTAGTVAMGGTTSLPDAGVEPDAGSAALVPACSELDPRTVPLEIAIQPDEGEAPFVNALATARKSIRVMVYQMGYGGVMDALTSKAQAGVDVRVILDLAQIDVNQKYHDALTAAGAKVEWSDDAFTYMHAKLLIIDETLAVISTGNYLESYVLKERNFAVTDRDPWDLHNLVDLFDKDFLHQTPTLDCTRMLISPVNARQRISSLIDTATVSLDIESMQFADKEIRAKVAARKEAGIEVRVLLANPSWIDANADGAAFLKSYGIPVRHLSKPSVHAKAIIADGARAYVGSENLSYTSLTKNREVGVVALDAPVVDAMQQTFESDWAAATPF
jgi:phosphatidylserine/phosphatidylglycerophosphate/cardiolipin synthase-like enzyme